MWLYALLREFQRIADQVKKQLQKLKFHDP
jgi:hypothetical protein